MNKFDDIRPFYDSEINAAANELLNHPLMKHMMNFFFPGKPDEYWREKLSKIQTVKEFQCEFAYSGIQNVLNNFSDGLTTSGFENIRKDTPYLFISNHRDIVLDTTLLNASLVDNGMTITASAIGDNLVKKPFLKAVSKMNRNFLVKRNLPPRETLESSKVLSELIADFLIEQHYSVWIAQRGGRTKDGNDVTNPGVLKMIGMASDEKNIMDYFKKLKIVPVAISYEYDPTDALKMPQLLAEANNEKYVKDKNEDLMTLLSGIIGQKKRMHIHIGKVLDKEIDIIKDNNNTINKQMQELAQAMDDSILANYKLWPTNFIAHDFLNNSTKYAHLYTDNEKQLFLRRLEMRIDKNNPVAVKGFMAMYANPVINKLKYTEDVQS